MLLNKIIGANASEIAHANEALDQSAPGQQTPGQPLPTIRELASALRVSPVTVAAAYRLLRTRGLAVGQGRRGTRLRPQSSPQPPALRSLSIVEGVVDLTTGNPDPELLPSIDAALRGLHHDQHLYGEPAELRSLIAFATAEFDADGIPSAAVTVTLKK